MNRESQDHTGSTWYRNAVFYSVDVARFKDSDGNGYGDFEGLTRSVDDLSWLTGDSELSRELQTLKLAPYGYSWWEQSGVPELSQLDTSASMHGSEALACSTGDH